MKAFKILITLLFIGCSAEEPILKYSLGDKVFFKHKPFYAKACNNYGVIEQYEKWHSIHRTDDYVYKINIGSELEGNHKSCPGNVWVEQERITGFKI